jgi:hypothetical protein
MGKRNKIAKGGFSKKNYQTVMKSKKDIKNQLSRTFVQDENMKKESQSSEENDESEEIVEQTNHNKSKYISKSFVNEEALQRHRSILGIDETMLNTSQHPLRHRREKHSNILSKGQRKRLEKREKFKRRKDLEEKIKLNNTMINQSMNKTQIKNSKKPETGFNLNEVDTTLMNLIEDIKNESEETKIIPNKLIIPNQKLKTRSKKICKKIINDEKQNILKIMENKNFQKNPMETMQLHIKSAQLMNERRKKAEENFQKNYNLLNIKK